MNVPDGDWSADTFTGTGQAYFVVDETARPDETTQLVRSVSYTAADGTEVAYEPVE